MQLNLTPSCDLPSGSLRPCRLAHHHDPAPMGETVRVDQPQAERAMTAHPALASQHLCETAS